MVHKHDEQWVKEQIMLLPPEYRSFAWDKYQEIYKEAYISEPVGHKRSNAARRKANTRLRKFVENILKNKSAQSILSKTNKEETK